MPLLDIFPEPTEMALSALCVMMVGYGYVLMRASEIIGDGCEMLVLLFGPGIVGGLIVPILGAIPDSVVILISGLGEGTAAEVQNQLSVGVGTLVGSTIMLLTVPWGLGVYLGRRDYDAESDCAARGDDRKPKLTHTSLWSNCVTVLPEIPATARIMILALFGYLLIQIPSVFCSTDADGGVACERPWALACLIGTAVAFFVYCFQQVRSAESAELERRRQESLRRNQWKAKLDHSLGSQQVQELVFRSFDKDNSGFIEPEELSRALAHLGLQVGRKDIGELMESIDVGHENDGDAGRADGRVSLHEFQDAVNLWVKAGQSSDRLAEHQRQASFRATPRSTPRRSPRPGGDGGSASSSLKLKKDDIKSDVSYGAMEIGHPKGHDDDEEEQEEEYWDLTESELKVKACLLLLFGTLCVTLFSDPLVDVITQVGDRLSVSPFYVAFVVTPFASNASEVYAGILFAKKKTNESISMTLATMHGAATMNSTLCLSIFMAIIYSRGLEWMYTAEVVAVCVVVVIVGAQTIMRRNIFLWQGLLVLSLYPLSILLIFTLQSFGLK